MGYNDCVSCTQADTIISGLWYDGRGPRNSELGWLTMVMSARLAQVAIMATARFGQVLFCGHPMT
jgi:hypothetical protein